MKVTPLKITDVKLIEPEIYEDERGFFFELYNQKKIEDILEKKISFSQDNFSFSKKNVLRGLHFQENEPQAKIVSVLNGRILDVAVDIRKDSKTFLSYVSVEISSSTRQSIFIPEGFAHGFLVLSDYAEVQYKVSAPWNKELERTIRWNDELINILWPEIEGEIILSSKDKNAPSLSNVLEL